MLAPAPDNDRPQPGKLIQSIHHGQHALDKVTVISVIDGRAAENDGCHLALIDLQEHGAVLVQIRHPAPHCSNAATGRHTRTPPSRTRRAACLPRTWRKLLLGNSNPLFNFEQPAYLKDCHEAQCLLSLTRYRNRPRKDSRLGAGRRRPWLRIHRSPRSRLWGKGPEWLGPALQ